MADVQRDTRHAEAFREMEGTICDLRRAGMLCELAAERVIDKGILCKSDQVQAQIEKMDMTGKLFVIPNGDLSTLQYALDQLRAGVEAMLKSYYADFTGVEVDDL